MPDTARKNKIVSDIAAIAASDIVETVPSALIVLDKDLNITSANRAFYQTFRTSAHETEGVTSTISATGSGIFPRCAPCSKA